MVWSLVRRSKTAATALPPPAAPRAVRDRQVNVKATADCLKVFDALAGASRMTKAELFEDMIAARLAELQARGLLRDL